ncbi:hypothetical protein M408DRAFT_93847 [Serendipita vermifera MAFF 305830]|uniref:Uncharacterized protein n=1 Tax=Serendipita vermifera MAFF 305830 TaxID=933852 RepID=A0A0C2XZM7_SERVB|nr:hypothetical protein M408DRAFT_93847 [Serendipita vermifera MAFF 305830]
MHRSSLFRSNHLIGPHRQRFSPGLFPIFLWGHNHPCFETVSHCRFFPKISDLSEILSALFWVGPLSLLITGISSFTADQPEVDILPRGTL